MIYGWTGKILHIDLDTRQVHVEEPAPEFYLETLGGRGMGGQYLRPHAALAWDHPRIPVCLFTGPLTATLSPCSGRIHLVSKSPLTGLIADSSLGGRMGFQLKRAGWDGVVITGQSPEPLGICIENDQVELKPAPDLWGLETQTVHEKILSGKAALACIGPAGETGARFASVTADHHHSASRTGLGLSFGAKKIKYIRVRGTGQLRVKDLGRLEFVREQIFRLTMTSPVLMGPFGFSRLGTGALYDLMDNRRMMPTDNFQKTVFQSARRLNAAAYARAYSPIQHGCSGCHILCKKIGRKGSHLFSMPEMDAMSHLSALIGNQDMNLVVLANERCHQLGLDPVSTASVLACRREITGFNYTQASLLSLIEDMAAGRGEGQLLSQGAAAYARARGKPDAAMTVKSLELPAYDPRGAYGLALGYALSTRGGCHLRAFPISHEILRKPVATDRFSFGGKARIIKIAEDQNAVADSLTACQFIFLAAGLEEYASAVTAVTGLDISARDLSKIGERICYNERIINAVNGFDVEEDILPSRFFTVPGSHGNQFPIPPIDREDFFQARKNYYEIRGLDIHGRPREKKARELKLTWKDR